VQWCPFEVNSKAENSLGTVISLPWLFLGLYSVGASVVPLGSQNIQRRIGSQASACKANGTTSIQCSLALTRSRVSRSLFCRYVAHTS